MSPGLDPEKTRAGPMAHVLTLFDVDLETIEHALLVPSATVSPNGAKLPPRMAAPSFLMTPIGIVRGGRAEPLDDDWARESCVIAIDPRFDDEVLLGLDAFSHLEVVYVFDRVDEAEIEPRARHPRGRTDWPRVGIFAQRGKGRPNRIGVSRCTLVRVEGKRVHVTGLDAIDGTPVLDLKPYMREFGPRGEVTQPAWATELMADYYVPATRG